MKKTKKVKPDASRWATPISISDKFLSLGQSLPVAGIYMPEKDAIPAELFDYRNVWFRCADRFLKEGCLPPELVLKKGLDPDAARRQLQACRASRMASMDHREAGVAYLLSLWYSIPIQ